jgi:hypothetical protein
LCREQAADLASAVEETGAGHRLVAIVGESVAVDGFLKGFKGGEVYLDKDNSIKTVLGSGKLRTTNMGFLLKPSTYSSLARAKKNHPELEAGSQSTDGFKLGGVMVISRGVKGDKGAGEKGILLHIHLEKVSIFSAAVGTLTLFLSQ